MFFLKHGVHIYKGTSFDRNSFNLNYFFAILFCETKNCTVLFLQ